MLLNVRNQRTHFGFESFWFMTLRYVVEWNLKLLWKIATVKRKNVPLLSIALSHVFQGTMNIPSLLDLGVPTRTFKGLKSYGCTQCHKQFNKLNSLKRHIMDKHVRKLHCDFCAFTCGASRRGLLDRHMQNKHEFPVPKQVLGVVQATVSSETISEATTYGPLETPFTDEIRVDEVDNFLESLCRGTEESVVSSSSPLTSVPPARTAVTAAVQPFVDPALTAATAAAPSPLNSGLPAATAAVPLVDYPESPSPPSCLPSVDSYPVNSPAPSPLGFSYARYYHSPASVPTVPVPSPAPLHAFSPAPLYLPQLPFLCLPLLLWYRLRYPPRFLPSPLTLPGCRPFPHSQILRLHPWIQWIHVISFWAPQVLRIILLKHASWPRQGSVP